jgi:hypothetical protein
MPPSSLVKPINARNSRLLSEYNSRYCNHSTVTDLARLRGKSTFKPSATASQYAISWSGMTLSRPCNKSTVLGTSIRSVFSGGNSSSPWLQITIGRPFRAMTRNNVSDVNLSQYGSDRFIPCWYALSDFAKISSLVRIMMIGRFSSTNAKTPCLSSPDMTASQ